MHWNNRVLRKTEYGETFLQIVEVYYNSEDDTIIGWTEKESVWSEDLKGLGQCLIWMTEALNKPILDEAELLQRAEEVEAMGADVHEVGLGELGDWKNV